jgi:predicted ATPase
VETGIAVSVRTGQRFFDAELHRLKGEILLASKVDRPQPAPSHAEGSCIEAEQTGEECFRRALEIAGAQQARSFELRAATSLARCWRDQSKRAEARDLLTPLYAWFTEGFDTADLVAARQLLEELE